MEENNKYYTPKITDIRIGYECEVNWSRGYSEEFEPLNTSLKDEEGVYDPNLDDTVIAYDDGYAEFRTKYLSKEDIESEGWIFKSKTVDLWFESDLEKAISLQDFYGCKCYKLYLNYGLHDHKLKIKGDFMGGSTFDESDTLFEGKCLSINEFRYITKELLGIE